MYVADFWHAVQLSSDNASKGNPRNGRARVYRLRSPKRRTAQQCAPHSKTANRRRSRWLHARIQRPSNNRQAHCVSGDTPSTDSAVPASIRRTKWPLGVFAVAGHKSLMMRFPCRLEELNHGGPLVRDRHRRLASDVAQNPRPTDRPNT